MTPQPTPDHHKIEISYSANPPGQKGVRPLRILRNQTFEFVNLDPGQLTLEFIDQSPLADGTMAVGPGQTMTASKSGRFLFKCRLVRPGGEVIELDPRTPGINGGGEIEVPPGI